MTERRRKKRTVRRRDWEGAKEADFSRDLRRHIRTDTTIRRDVQAPPVPEQFEPNGLVIAQSKKWAFVEHEGEEKLCRISDRLFEGPFVLLAPGDRVLVEMVEGDPMVLAFAPRRSRLARLAVHGETLREQIIAANVDQLVIVASAAQPVFKASVVDRYLIIAQAAGIDCVLCVNKTDLTVEGPSQVAAYREQGVSVFLTSCETGAGIGELSEQLRERVSVVAGQSGVGKSSLLNRLDPSLEIDTQEVSGYNDKGKHTTTGARLYRLANGIIVIDTPGIRQLGIANVSINELPFYFPEFAARAGACQFSDCTHTHEPNCAVREAVESGEVSAHRYGSYLRIREDITARATKY